MKNKYLFLLISLFISSELFSQRPYMYSQNTHSNIQKNLKKKNKKSKPKPKNEIEERTRNCQLHDGLFKLHQSNKDGKAYFELDTSHLDKEYIYFSYFENGVGDAGAVKGRYRGSKIIKISKFYNKIDFTIENTKFFFDPSNPLSKASKTNINTPLIISEKIVATSPCKTKFLISADNIFLNESFQQVKYSYSSRYKGFRLGNLNSSKTRYSKIRNYPENTDVLVNYVYESKYPSTRGGEAITDSRSVSVMVQHSIIRMPDDGYEPRHDDSRVGYFTTQTNDMTTIDRVNYRDFINRWRLVKKDSLAEISEPIKPIVWWIENTTPHEFRDIIKEGVESWNIAFNEAGFKNAVQVMIQPDTATWDAGDIRYNVLRWTSSPEPPWGGYGPSFVNPRTGEIIGADIMLEWTHTTRRIYERNLYLEEAHDLDHTNHEFCNAAKYQQLETTLGADYIKTYDLSKELEEDLVKQSLYRLVLHEVGHTLGLSHNFKGSTLLSTKELNDKQIVSEKGVCNSVMEYPAINIANNPENQGLFFDIKPGFYDIWAIQYGYTQNNDKNLENKLLSEILSRSTEKELAFANDASDMRRAGKGMDPNAMIYDLSSNPMDHSIDKMNMIIEILENLKDKYTDNNDTYQELYQSYRTLVYSYFQSLNIVSRQIGGVHIDFSKTDQNSQTTPFKSVDKDDQLKAMKILSEYGFSNKVILQEEIFPFLQEQRRGFRVSPDPTIHQRILTYQNRLLDQLLHPTVLLRITNSSLYGNEYSLSSYMIDLRNAIFLDDINGDVSSVRQNIQISYLKRLLRIVSASSSYDNISQGVAYYNLDWLKKNINIRTGNLSSRQHKQYVLYLIDSLEK